MSGFSYPPPIFLSSTYNPAFYLSLDPSGFLTYAYAQTLYLSKNDYRLSYITGVTLGQGAAGLVLTLDSSRNVSNINMLTATSISVGSLSGVSSLTLSGTLSAATITATGAQTLSAATININPTTLQIRGTTLSATTAELNKLSGVTATTAELNKLAGLTSTTAELNYLDLTTGAGTAEASKALVLDSSKDVTGVNSIELNNPTTVAASSLMTDYSLILRRGLDTAASTSGICFASTSSAASAATPGSAIIFKREAAASPAGMLSFFTKGTSGAADALSERMRIASDGKISFGDVGSGDWNMLKFNTNSSLRLGGSDSWARGCILLTWKNVTNNILTNQNNGLKFDMNGSSNAFFISEFGCGINCESPVGSKLQIVADATNMYGSWKRGIRMQNNNTTPMIYETIIYNENGGSQNLGIVSGSMTNDPIGWMINGQTRMTLNTSSRLAVDRTGPEATIHSGGQIWADDAFHCKGNASNPYYRWNWAQSGYPAIGNHANASTIRIGICDANFAWTGYAAIYGGSYTNGSDRDYKRDIRDIPYGLDTVLQMRPKAFVWKQDDRPGIGFIAQELQPVCPIPVSGDPNRPVNPETGMPPDGMGIDYASLTAVLCRAIQEIAARIEALEQAVVNNT